MISSIPDDQLASIQKIQGLLKAKDDTSRFVGLALLKSLLDTSQELRENEQAVLALWDSISPKFLDRLIRTGSNQDAAEKNAKDMLDLAVSVIHTFCLLLPGRATTDTKFLERIPRLVSCLVCTSGQTEELILQTLLSLVSQQDGAAALVEIEDVSPLTEIAPSQPLVLDILSWTWLQCKPAAGEGHAFLAAKIDSTLNALMSSFKGTDAVTLLSFLASLLRKLDPQMLSPSPPWLHAAITFIRALATKRPNAAAREAYTNLSATLLQLYPIQTTPLLFSSSSASSTGNDPPFSYLFITLLLIDIRSTLPTLLSQLNSPSYPPTSTRLASAYDVLTAFTGHLLRSLDPSSSSSPTLPADRILSLRKSIAETLSLTVEHLRDRWDAAVAGARGLHPEARHRSSTAPGAPRLLTWDAGGGERGVADDPLVLAAVRALALWLREDDGSALRAEAAGLTDMFVALYGAGANASYRLPVLAALEGVAAEPEGVEAVLEQGAWGVLSDDLVAALGEGEGEEGVRRGVEIVRLLLPIVEAETPGPREEWMELVGRVVEAWGKGSGKEEEPSAMRRECWAAVLQLVTALLVGAHEGIRRRYRESTRKVIAIAERLQERTRDDVAKEELEDIVQTLEDIC